MSSDERAYELLKWQALAPLSEFDEDYPYADIQRKRSDAALDVWEQDHRYEQSDELKAFHTLESMGVFTQSDFFSPTKAKDGYYLKRLREHVNNRAGRRTGGDSKPRRATTTRRYRR